MTERLFSYVIVHDSGSAPNPFDGILTLATCKPKIRKVAQPGDWIMGTGSASAVGIGRVVYAAEISEILPIARYGIDPRFEVKRPTKGRTRWSILGDNIYFPGTDGILKQRCNPFHSSKDIEHDLSGRNVLVCERFWYFGSSAPELPAYLRETVKRGPGHRCVRSSDLLSAIKTWFNVHPQGMAGTPFLPYYER